MLTFLLWYWLLPTEEECKTECLSDCSWEAVLFMTGECKKQRLPLRFERRIQSEVNVALIKVAISKPTSKNELRVDILIISVSLVAFAFIV